MNSLHCHTKKHRTSQLFFLLHIKKQMKNRSLKYCKLQISACLPSNTECDSMQSDQSHPVEGDGSVLQAAGLFYKLQDSLAT